MASGSVALTTDNQYIVGSLTWSSTPNTVGNYSDVTVTVRLWRNNSGYTTYGSGSWATSVNGVVQGASKSVTLVYNSASIIMTDTVRVAHNSDGTKSIGINATGGIPSTSYTATYCNGGSGKTIVLDTIPRASTPTASPTPCNIGGTLTILGHRADGSFTHKYYYAFGTIGKTAIKTYGALPYDNDATWVLPTALANQIPSAKTGTGLIYCDTYNSAGTLLGSKTVGFTAQVPDTDTYHPTISTVAVAETVAGVTALTLGSGRYVQAISNTQFTISGIAGIFGSTVTTVKVTFNGTTYNATVASGSATWSTGVLAVGGTLAYSITATDSRGFSVTTAKTGSVVVLPYTPPLISAFTAKRCDVNGNLNEVGTYLFIDRDGAGSSLKDGSAVEKNTLACTVQWSPKDANTWTAMSEMAVVASSNLAITTAGIKSTKTDFTLTSAYDIKFTLTDKFNNTVATQIVTVGTVVMSWGKSGVGIGKVWQQGALDVLGDIYLNNASLTDTFAQMEEGMYNPSSGFLIDVGDQTVSTMYTVEITGNGYGTDIPVNTHIQFYHYTPVGTLLNMKQLNLGATLGTAKVFLNAGRIQVWIPCLGSAVTYKARAFKFAVPVPNLVCTNVAEPTGTNKVSCVVTNSIHNVPAFTLATTTGTVTSGLSTVVVTHNLGYLPLVTLGGTRGNVMVTYDLTTTTIIISAYSSGNNAWTGTVRLY